MRRVLAFLLLVFLAGMGVGSHATAQEKTGKKAKAASTTNVRWHGNIVRTSKDASTITVRKGNIERIVHYDGYTQWTKTVGRETTTIDPSGVKEGDNVICLGKFNDKGEFTASRIDLRVPRMMP